MKRHLLSAVCVSVLLTLYQSPSFSTPAEQAQAQAVRAGTMVFGESPVRQELFPSSESLKSQVLGVGDAYQLRIIYMIPSNRSPQPAAEEKLQHYVVRMQSWFSENMELSGYGPKTFQYEAEADGITPKVNVVYVAQPDTYFHGDYLERWSNVLNGIAGAGYPPWQRGELLLVVAEMQVQVVDGSFMESTVFFGGAGGDFQGVGMVTGETLARFPETFLTDDRFYDGLIIPDMGPYPLVQNISFPWFEGSTVSSTSSSAQGGTLHELAHGLSLWHDFRNDENFNGNLMGNGLRGIRGAIFPDLYPDNNTRLADGSALQLNYNRFFNPAQTFSEDTRPQVEILTQGTVVPQSGLCKLDFTAYDADSLLGGAILIRAGHVVAEMPLSENSVTTAIATYDYSPGVEDTWIVQVFDVEGNRAFSIETLATCAEGYNQAPTPYISVSSHIAAMGENVTLDASRSFDPDGDSTQMTVEWDLDGDGAYDTAPSTDKTHVTAYSKPGIYQIVARLTDEVGDSSRSMSMGVRIEAIHQMVTVDIKPGSEPNSINLKSKGKIPVAVLTTDAFDAVQVDWETAVFGPDVATESHGRSHVEDVDGDGDMDIVLHFNIQETGIACGDTEATLTGETFSGETFSGSDAVRIVKCR
jgi:hypothetical protein